MKSLDSTVKADLSKGHHGRPARFVALAILSVFMPALLSACDGGSGNGGSTVTPSGAVRNKGVNSAAVDPNTHSVLMNSEDGFLYRWDLSTGLLSQKIWLDNGYGQAYTPTALGPDGTVYSINNGSLFAIGQ